MLRAVSATPEPRFRWRLGWGGVSAATVCALLLALVCLAPVSPCTRYTEVELVGACWAPHEIKAPCPEDLFEHQGKCYMPTFSAKPPPSALGQ